MIGTLQKSPPVEHVTGKNGDLAAAIDRNLFANRRYLDALVTLLNRNAPTLFNVFGYGAKGDGLTNDRTAINAAVAAANAAGGGIVYLPPGTYGIGAGAGILMYANVRLMGAGRATIIKALASTNPTHLVNFETNSPTDAGIENCVIDGNRSNQSSGTSLIVMGLNAARITIEHCWLKDPYALGFFGNFTTSTGEVYIRWNRGLGTFGATAGADHAIKLTYPSLVECRHEIIGNYIPWSAGFGYSLLFCEGVTVSENHAIGDTTGLLNEGFNLDRCRACVVTSNIAKYRGDFGFTFHSSNTSSLNDGHTFVGNIAEFNKEAGLAITGKTRYSTFVGNTLRNNSQNAVAYPCEIVVDTGSGTAKPSFNLIQGNSLVDDQGSPTASSAIIINGANCEDTQIGKNNIYGIGLALSDTGTRTRIWGDGVGGNYVVGFGRTEFLETDPITLSGVSGAVLVGGVGSGAHLAEDLNGIQAKGSGTTVATLNLNKNGGSVNIAGSLTTQNTDVVNQINSGTNAGANDKTAATDYARGTTVLWRAGIQGAIATDGSYRLRDIVNSKTQFIVSTGEIRANDDFAYANRRIGSVVSPAQIVANTNNYNPTGEDVETWRLNTDASRNITGIANGAAARWLQIVNVGAQNIVLQNVNAGSAAANQIITGTGADITVLPDDIVELWYDGTTAMWRVTAHR